MVGWGIGPPRVDHLVVILSDVEMGAGGPEDDCPHTERIADLLLTYDADFPIDFVFNGDTFDFLKTRVGGRYPRYVSEAVALAKLERIAAAHRPFFEKLGRIPTRHRIAFIVGNHDFELQFPAVQRALERLIGRPLCFPGLAHSIGDLRIEHGSQGDALFRIDPERVFIDHEGETILNLPWGAVGVIDTVLPYHAELFALDRVRPKEALFRRLPEAKELLVALARRYWLGAFWHDLLVARDPLKRVTFPIVKEVAYRLAVKDADVTFGDHYLQALRADPDHRVIVVGHEHVAREVREPGRVLLTTGCLRNEYMVGPHGALVPSVKTIAEVRFRDGRAIDARLVQVAMPSPPPPDLEALRPVVLRYLEALEGAPIPAFAVRARR